MALTACRCVLVATSCGGLLGAASRRLGPGSQNLDSPVHDNRVICMFKIALNLTRRRLFNMLTDSRILKGVLLIMRPSRQNQYGNQPSHKHSSPPPPTRTMSTTTFATRLFAVCLALCLTSCQTPAGKGQKAEAGYKAAAPVIAALEKFHEKRGHYPADLHELVPEFLPDARTLLYRGRVQPVNAPRHTASIPEQEFGYHLDGDAYGLMFSYTGPGMNHCWYDSNTRTWSARGYY